MVCNPKKKMGFMTYQESYQKKRKKGFPIYCITNNHHSDCQNSCFYKHLFSSYTVMKARYGYLNETNAIREEFGINVPLEAKFVVPNFIFIYLNSYVPSCRKTDLSVFFKSLATTENMHWISFSKR